MIEIKANQFGMCEEKNVRLPMRILILFSTTEGHTGKLAQFAAAQLTRRGHEVRVHDAVERNLPDLAGFDVALLLASVHVGHYQHSFIEFVRKNHDALNAMPSAFISVSLSAAGDNPSDLAGLRDCLESLECDTLWHPGAVHHAAGAMLFSAYGLFTKLRSVYRPRTRHNCQNISRL